mgnify:CR=1 FL=1
MSVRVFTLIFGIFYTLVGILGFIPGLLSTPPGGMGVTVDSLYGLLLGLFPVNILHSIVHLLIGIWGILAYRSFDASKAFNKINAIIFAVLTVMGLIPGLDTTFGLIPLYGADVWLHALTTLATAYFGYVAPADRPAEV